MITRCAFAKMDNVRAELESIRLPPVLDGERTAAWLIAIAEGELRAAIAQLEKRRQWWPDWWWRSMEQRFGPAPLDTTPLDAQRRQVADAMFNAIASADERLRHDEIVRAWVESYESDERA